MRVYHVEWVKNLAHIQMCWKYFPKKRLGVKQITDRGTFINDVQAKGLMGCSVKVFNLKWTGEGCMV